ncbi:MAG: DNA alkylation repair protein [Bacteroidales bacterium]|nr:DNA alkylation repair protein [Bacteroidales bacterium]
MSPSLFKRLDRYDSHDSRNFVRKAVNWALRQIGKKNERLLYPALALAGKLSASANKTATWIGKDAVRELRKYDKPSTGTKL